MNENLRNVLIVIGVILVIGAFVIGKAALAPGGAGSQTDIKAVYACNAGKSITAVFHQGETKPGATADQPPTPGGSVDITLSDGRTMTLAQTISADGTRYSDGNPNTQGSETFVFWSKGQGALVLENNEEKSYVGCIEVADDPGTLPTVYQNGQDGFSIRLPAGFTVDENYKYQALGPGRDISGVKFTIPAATAAGTNLGADTYLSIESLPGAINSCSAEIYLDGGKSGGFVDVDGRRYSVASTTGAGAGNRYEETVFATPVTNGCLAVRYFIHYGAIENYPPDSVKEFDKQALMNQFDSIRNTLTISQ